MTIARLCWYLETFLNFGRAYEETGSIFSADTGEDAGKDQSAAGRAASMLGANIPAPGVAKAVSATFKVMK